MPLEIECKLFIDDLATIQNRIKDSDAICVKPRTYEYNLRLSSDHHNFIAEQIVLRLRQDDQIRLTYKAPATDVQAGAKTRLELETTVGDLDTMIQILTRLGFHPYMMYEKYRTTYHYPTIDNTELVIDEMPFGNFIEVEGEALEDVLQLLELQDHPRILESYAQLFDRVKKHHKLDFTDLSFANFQNVDIDDSVFQSEQ